MKSQKSNRDLLIQLKDGPIKATTIENDQEEEELKEDEGRRQVKI